MTENDNEIRPVDLDPERHPVATGVVQLQDESIAAWSKVADGSAGLTAAAGQTIALLWRAITQVAVNLDLLRARLEEGLKNPPA